MLAEEQYLQGNYRLAVASSLNYLSQQHPSVQVYQSNLIEKAKYIRISSCLKLNTEACADSAKVFITKCSDPVYRQRTAFNLAEYFFSLNRFAEAIPYYISAGVSNLNNEEIVEEKFELSYCYFSTRQFDKAEPLLASIKELQEGKYYSEANYYYGLLAYNANNYRDALQSFDRIKSLAQYRSIVPYYIAEIYYYTSNRKKAFDYAVELINQKEKLYYDNELHLLAAQCLFEDASYKDALPYFEYYYDNTDRIRKEDLYEMAYCYYRENDWDKAIDKFKLLSNTRDSLGQTAMYLLGDAYLKSGDKKSARNAFGYCAEMPFNRGQQEASMILYAKLSYEMGYDEDAIGQLKNLLNSYPNSSYRDEAKTLLSDLLIRSGDYADAFNDMLDVTNKDNSYQQVYQKVTYGYAIQQYQAGNLVTADSFLSMSLLYPVNEAYTAVAYFWKGEIAYRLQRYADAIDFNQSFLIRDKDPYKTEILHISPAATAQHANLNMGYAAMGKDDYSNSQHFFNSARTIEDEDSSTGMVATLREADAVFMQKDYTKAITLYDQIIATHASDSDYAKFQKTKLLGLLGKKNEKNVLLLSIINNKPASKYTNSARYELALEYIEENKYAQAITMLQPLTEAIDARAFATKAWMKIGFAYQQMQNNEKAIESYKHIVTDYASSDELNAALDAIKNLYIESGQPGVYARFLKENKLPSGDSAALDSTFYATAELQFASGDWNNAIQAFTQYLQNYPSGVFVAKAHYYRAECYNNIKNYKDALADYDTVLNTPWNDFSENSAYRAASISYTQKDFAASFRYFLMLRNTAMGQEKLRDAYSGLMKSSYGQKNYLDAASYADTLLTLPGVDDADIGAAMLVKAIALQQAGKYDDALNNYRQLDNVKYGVIAAEARYHIAEILLAQKDLKGAEEAANNNIKLSSGYDYWIVKSYILLADILTEEKDYFNAKATLQSIVKNARIPELKQEAAQKLDHVRKLDRQKTKLEE
jgi:TolA-binding protein